MNKPSVIFFVASFLVTSVSFAESSDPAMKIALTKASPNYVSWILKGNPDAVIVDLNGMDPGKAGEEMKTCSGLVITGGGDIDPGKYGEDAAKAICKDVDENRDLLEAKAIAVAYEHKMPVLGICRGEQMINVVNGGTLVPDIPSYRKDHPSTEPVIHQCDDYLHCYHKVKLDPASFLRQVIGFDTGFVTTNHHQAALLAGKGLEYNAWSEDGIPEGVEWKDAAGKPFMVGVQWHPERMDVTNAFSGNLLHYFLEEAKKYSLSHQK
jgi:putative glutamine amidotransferase